MQSSTPCLTQTVRPPGPVGGARPTSCDMGPHHGWMVPSPPPSLPGRSNAEEMTSKYPDILARLPGLLAPGVKSLVFDAEAVGWDCERKKILPFQVRRCRCMHAWLLCLCLPCTREGGREGGGREGSPFDSADSAAGLWPLNCCLLPAAYADPVHACTQGRQGGGHQGAGACARACRRRPHACMHALWLAGWLAGLACRPSDRSALACVRATCTALHWPGTATVLA